MAECRQLLPGTPKVPCECTGIVIASFFSERLVTSFNCNTAAECSDIWPAVCAACTTCRSSTHFFLQLKGCGFPLQRGGALNRVPGVF